MTALVIETDIQGESQNFCHCVRATNDKYLFIKNTAFSSENFVPCVKSLL